MSRERLCLRSGGLQKAAATCGVPAQIARGLFRGSACPGECPSLGAHEEHRADQSTVSCDRLLRISPQLYSTTARVEIVDVLHRGQESVHLPRSWTLVLFRATRVQQAITCLRLDFQHLGRRSARSSVHKPDPRLASDALGEKCLCTIRGDADLRGIRPGVLGRAARTACHCRPVTPDVTFA